MTARLDEVRERWMSLRDQYAQFGEYVVARARDRLRRAGIAANVTSREKAIDSFLKKVIRKKLADPFEEMHDKIGVRITIPFVSQLDTVDVVIRDLFDVRRFEDKSESLGPDKFAYQSWHYDILLKEPVPKEGGGFRGLWCEIQLRTECHHLWAEMSHRLLYKSGQTIPEREARRVHRLNALLEIADYEFEATRDALLQQPGAWSAQVLAGLEGLYYEFTGRNYDKELSLEILDCVRPLFPGDPQVAVAEAHTWAEAHRGDLAHLVEQYKDRPERALFLFQPEGILLLTQLERDRFTLRERWAREFPEDELRELATIFALAFD